MNKSALLPIEESTQKAVSNTFPRRSDLHFILGVSGGIDSTCLLHLFKRLEIKTTVFHINYGTRGAASDNDAAFVQKQCEKLNINCITHNVNPQEANFSNFQAWARDVRYRQFKKAAKDTDADGVAVAHHKNDQIETIVQKIFRGAGLASWSGMEVWNGWLFRPLLTVSRDEIEKYCQKKSIPYRTDQSNNQSNYARNFLRNEWLPQLKNHFPGWQQNVLRAAEQSDIFNASLQYILADIEEENGLNRAGFLSLPLPLQKSLFLFFIQKKAPDISLSATALGELHKLPDLQTGKKIQLTDRLSLMRNRTLLSPVFEQSNRPEPRSLKLKELKTAVSYAGIEFKIGSFNNPNFIHKLYLDIEKLSWPVKVRPWKHGDKIQPLGMQGHQTVADLLTNQKVSAADKNRAMVIESFEESLAAVIFPPIKNSESPGTIAEKYKCGDSTRKTLIIKPTS